ncbi:anthranilate phosphoribosyltransferase [Saccharomycopsis crataegensis]|uniref:Anthranilate phosphoribosyltransferase n=1 Tax=Saccharomycopsis crataegensis TaxID=43959 RepID=A0AAV5QT05_9ASCO|nr:anthranilate phosphoribosyltransferase [Saccharomycopsis crataegensis]
MAPATSLSSTALTPYIKSLLLSPPNLTPNDLAVALRLIFQQIPSDIQVASFLTALSLSKLDKDAKYISTAVQTILEFSDVPNINSSYCAGRIFTDIVGTGGDGQNTFNVSTSSAIVVAGIPNTNVVVTKHGGKASTSNSGAGDLIARLGINTAKINAKTIPKLIEEDNNKFIFLFAPSFHNGMRIVADVRKQLGIPSIFNILGPLLNPIRLQSRVLGVFSEELGYIYAQTAKELYPKLSADELNGSNKYSTIVVWGEVGLDEVSPIGRSKIWYIDPISGEIQTEYISPKDFGLPEHSLESVRSGTPQENANVLMRILKGDTTPADKPIVDYILMNSSVLAVSSGIAADWKDGVRLAKESLKTGGALEALVHLCEKVDQL